MKTIRFEDTNGHQDLHQQEQSHQAVLRTTRTALENSKLSSSATPVSNNGILEGPTHIPKAPKTAVTRKEFLPRISTCTKKNNASLMELHLTLGHRNFRDIAEQFNLTLPDPVPLCWACLMAKPVALTPDKFSTRLRGLVC
jgi:hypothetical protein